MKENHVHEIRAFNRLYTDVTGLLDKYILNSRYSLPEVRVLYELYHQSDCTAKQIMKSFNIDKGYLSRILLKFQKDKLLTMKQSKNDGRSVHLMLTNKGKKEFKNLNQAAQNQVKTLLKDTSDKDCDKLVYCMNEIKKILSNKNNERKD
jgi:DNA-binding MarR family transcriptional regulator